jgi:hypothetical protein
MQTKHGTRHVSQLSAEQARSFCADDPWIKGVFGTALLLILLLCSTECLSNRSNSSNSTLKKYRVESNSTVLLQIAKKVLQKE